MIILKQVGRTYQLPSHNNLIPNKHKVASFLVNVRHEFSKFDCQNCHKIMAYPECKACDRMVNYFQIFKIPSEYKIDPAIIKEIARDLQKQFHPDKYSENSAISLQQKMLKYSTYINEAKATLLNDLQRAIYLMQLKGVVINEEIQIKDSSFMFQIFQLNEEIEDANLPQIQSIKRRIQKIIQQLQTDLQQFFNSEDMVKCKEFIIKYKYLHRALLNTKIKLTLLQQQHSSSKQ